MSQRITHVLIFKEIGLRAKTLILEGNTSEPKSNVSAMVAFLTRHQHQILFLTLGIFLNLLQS